MKVTGIIAEYNPFHNGHLYQIQQIHEKQQADYIVVVMSGDFVQRGTPALCNKYARAKMALSCGADLVLELPTLWATASAEYFAAAGIALLDQLGVADSVCFGAECDDLALLTGIADVLAVEPEDYQRILSDELKKGVSFPAARKHALLAFLNRSAFPDKNTSAHPFEQLLDTPNNILAIEYLKALRLRNSSMTATPLLRQGSGYHDTDLHEMASASAIRSALKEGKEHLLTDAMPDASYTVLMEYARSKSFLDADSLSSYLNYKLLMQCEDGYEAFADCGRDFSNRIENYLPQYRTFSGFCDLLKNKTLTHTRISRALLHILLDIRREDYTDGLLADYTPYARILGFRKDSAALLSACKKQSSIPLITKMADAEKILETQSIHPDIAKKMLALDVRGASIYESLAAAQTGMAGCNEYTQGILRI